jgi:hypothetical protein
MSNNTNRIILAVERMQAQIAAHPEADLGKAASACALTPVDVATFNETRAWAQASGVLSHDESVSLWAILGPGGWREDATLAGKIALMKTMQELLSARRRS